MVNAREIIRYNLDTGNSENMLDDAQHAPQVVSADADARVLYWANFTSSRYEIMKTTYNKETSYLNIYYAQPVALAQDLLHLYVLDRSRNVVDKYKKTTLEKVLNISVTDGTEEIIIIYGMNLYSCSPHKIPDVLFIPVPRDVYITT